MVIVSYYVEITKKAQKQLLSLPDTTQARLAEAIGLLAHNPFQLNLNVKILSNDKEAKYRLRVGNYRIKFNRNDSKKVISIIKIGHRKDIYK
jgi:mRNA interferase RelE/StbE